MSRSPAVLAQRALAAGAVAAVALTMFDVARPGIGRPHRIGPGVVQDVEVALAAQPAGPPARAAGPGLQAQPQAGPAGSAAAAGALLSPPIPVGKARFVGFSWPRPPAAGAARSGRPEPATLRLRTRTGGRWSGWRELDPAGDGPDPGTPEDRGGRVYSDGHWLEAGTSDLQLRVEGAPAATAGPAAGLAAHLITPDMTATPGTEPARPNQATAMTVRPAIVGRAAWGARESLRRAGPSYGATVKAAFVHHTVQSNGYAPSESAALVRAAYLYHVRSRGWNDIGYNFLVDRYGRVFEGRYGGVARAVLGAHTGGFNTDTTGVALLGTFTTSRPPPAMLAALERLLAWKLDLTHVDPLGTTVLTSRGGATARYPAGRRIRVPTILGHRTTSWTACPGGPTVALLGRVRAAAARIGRPKIYGGRPGGTSVIPDSGRTVSVAARFNPAARWAIRVTASNGAVVRHWHGTGRVAHVRWAGRTQAGRLPPPGWASVAVTARAGSAGARPVVSDLYVRRANLPLDGTTTGGWHRGRWSLTSRNVDQEGRPTFTRLIYGLQPGDRPVVGDWDGDGTQTVGVIRRGQLWLRNSSTRGGPPNVPPFRYGRPTDRFVFGDWDGDGSWTPGVVRDGVWHLRNSNTPGGADIPPFRVGRAGDHFLVGDWDGDGDMTPGVVRDGFWYLRNANTTGRADVPRFRFGRPGDLPYVGDWDGDGDMTPGVLRAGARWYLGNDLSGRVAQGLRKQTPGTAVVGDWDGRP